MKNPSLAAGRRGIRESSKAAEDRAIALEPAGDDGYSLGDDARSNPARGPATLRDESDRRTRFDDPERSIEDWIVRSLDDEPPPSLNRVLDRMLSASSGTRRARPRADRGPDRADPGPDWSRFRVDRARGVSVVTLLDSSLVKQSVLDDLEAEIEVLIASGARRVVLNFAGVERLSSRFVLTMSRAARKCAETPGGRLRASHLRPEIAGIGRLIPAIETFADDASAVEAPWPGPPIVTPLPVSILSELTSEESLRMNDKTLELEAREDLSPFEYPDDLDLSRSWNAAAPIGLVGPDGRSIPIEAARFLIGREPGCHLRLDSPSVSRVHASIEILDDRAVFRDLGSTNGSVLNGVPIRDRSATLKDGDRIEIDAARFVFRVGIEARPSDLDARVLGWLADDDQPESPETLLDHEPRLPDALAKFGLEEYAEVLRCELVEDVVILTPLTDELDDESRIEPVRSALLDLFGRRSPRRVVLNLAFVSRLSSHATGVLVAHHLRLLRSGGGLRCCLAQPLVASYLKQIRLPMIVDLYPTLEDAVLTSW